MLIGLMGVGEPRAVASSLPGKRAWRKAARPCLHAVFAGASRLVCMVPASALVQQRTAGRGIISSSLPDATLPHSDPQNSAEQTPPAEGSASVAGTVLDVSGASVPGADVSLIHGDGTQLLTMVSEANGEFNFTKIPAGSYLVTVNAKGFAPFTSPEFAVAVEQAYEVPDVYIGVAFGAGIEQATNAYSGYGQGAAGYRKRYAATFADGRISDFLTNALFPALLRQDPRYFYRGSGSFKSRLGHAVISVFVTRGDTGRTVPNSSYLLGDMCSAALSNLYYPKTNRGASLVFTNAAVGLAGRTGLNLFREFLSKRLTKNVAADGRL